MALLNDNISTRYYSALASQSEWNGGSSVGEDYLSNDGDTKRMKVIRYDPEFVKNHITCMMKRESKEITFNGVEALKNAANTGLLRQGQLIFGTVSVAHARDVENSLLGWLANTIAPFLMKIKTGQMRNFAYLHTAVFAGKLNGKHYVIHNDGADETGYGFIDVSTLDEAFEKDSDFFVVSPPKDFQGESTRYLVLQRALASLGLEYIYNMRAVSCETFATALFGLLDDNYFAPLQLEVLRTHKKEHSDIDSQKMKDIEKFKKFHGDLCNRIKQLPTGTILTLEFYLNGRKNKWLGGKSTKPWFQVMTEAYTRYLKAAKSGDTKACLDLLKMGLNPEGREPNTGTAVMEAVREGHWETVAALVQEGADRTGIQSLLDNALNDAAAKGHTQICLDLLKLCLKSGGKFPRSISSSLEAAVRAGHEETVSALIKEGVDGGEAIVVAAEEGNTRMVDLLLTLTPHTHQRDTLVSRALLRAAAKGHTQICLDLLKLCLNPGGKFPRSISSSLEAAVRAGHEETVSALINEGVDGGEAIVVAAQVGNTRMVDLLLTLTPHTHQRDTLVSEALLQAAKHGHTSTAVTLINHNANIEHKNTTGCTALIYAALNGHTDTVKVLLSLKANIEHKSNNGNTALTNAAFNGHTSTVTELLRHKANIEQKINLGHTALTLAAQEGHTDTVALLISHGANIEHITNDGATPLFMAAQNGHTDTVNALLLHRANIHYRDNHGATALINAAYNGHTDTVITLLKHGADIHHRENIGRTALSLALGRGHTDTVNVLRSHETNAGIGSST